MSALAEFEGTSLRRPVEIDRPESTIRFGGIMDEQGTTSGLTWVLQVVLEPVAPAVASTAPARAPQLQPSSAAAALTELRNLTGFTWEQVARILGVTPRTPFLWSQGNTLSKSNEERLQRLVSLLRRHDRGSPDATRATLLGARSDGVVPFDALALGDFARAEALLSVGPATRAVATEELKARVSPEGADRLLASDAKLHVDSGVQRTARSVRVKKGD